MIVDVISHLILYVLLTVAVIGDFKKYRISNRLILVGLGFAFLFRIVGSGIAGIIWFLPDILFPVVIFYLLYLAGILGAGDIKLFSVICGFTNLRFTIVCMVAAFLSAAVPGIIKLTLNQEFIDRMSDGIAYCRNILCGQFVRYESRGKAVSFSIDVLVGTVTADILFWQYGLFRTWSL